MKRRFYLALLAIPAVAVMLATIPGCPNKEGKKPEGPTPAGTANTPGTESGKSAKVAFVVTKADGTIKGRVIYDGTPPVMPDIKLMESSGDKLTCHSGDEGHAYRHKEQTWIVGKDHGVANVLVTLEPPEGKFFALDKAQAEKYKDKDATIDQPYCVFEPHVVGVFAAYKDKEGKLHQTGATLLVKNSSKLGHNTHCNGDGKRDAFNANLNSGDSKSEKIVYSPNRFLDIVCDKHNWMKAKLVTVDNPFFAVTDMEGNFEIKNVPTGVELTLKTWHEEATTATEKVDAKAGETKTVPDLKIKAKPAS